jgi:hypothetical protein
MKFFGSSFRGNDEIKLARGRIDERTRNRSASLARAAENALVEN